MKSFERNDFFQLSFVLLVAAATRIYKLGNASLWIDEAWTIQTASFPLSTLWVTAYDPTPPLYYTIIKWVLHLGNSESLLRFPSFLFGTLTIVIVYIAVRKFGSSIAAFTASLLLAFSFSNIEYSQEARAYALTVFCISVSFLGLASLYSRWRKSTTEFSFSAFIKSGGGLLGLGLIAALYSHNSAIFYWVGVQFFFLAWWARPFNFSKSCLVYWISINLCVLLLWLPWLFASLTIIEQEKFTWLQHYDYKTAFTIWRTVHGQPVFFPGQPYIDIVLLSLGIIGLYSLRREHTLLVMLIAFLVLSSIAMWSFGLFATPIYMSRTILWGSLFSAILIGLGVAALPRWPGYGLVLVIGAIGMGSIPEYYKTNRAENEDWRSAAAVVIENAGPRDIVIFQKNYIWRPFLYYFEDFSTDWTIVGWSCSPKREATRQGTIKRGDQTLEVTWSKPFKGIHYPLASTQDANMWVIVSHCPLYNWNNRAKEFFQPNWIPQKAYGFKFVTVFQLKPAR